MRKEGLGHGPEQKERTVTYSAERLNAIIRSAVDGVITIDERGIIQSMNPAALVLFQYDDGEVIGRNVSLLMPEPHRSGHDTYLANYHRTGEKKIIGTGRQVSGRRKDGSEFPLRLSISEVHTEDGRIYTGFVHDLTDQVRTEQQLLDLNRSLEQKVQQRTEKLRATNKELKVANTQLKAEITRRKGTEHEIKQLLEKEIELGTLKSRFLSMASHEFRTPLSGILTSATLISKYRTTEEFDQRQKHVERIRTWVHDLTNILNDFLSLDRIQSGKLVTHPGDFDPVELIAEVCDEVRPGQGSDLRLERQHAGISGKIHLDRNILKNVLLNLLSNAIKYSKPHGRILVRSEVRPGLLILDVEDNGIGIPEADQKHLFGRFFRAQNAVNIKGTGLGLNIVKRYLELMNGEIDFSSTEGDGTTFTVTIPVQHPDAT